MNFDKPKLVDMVRKGRSAVYVKNKATFEFIHDKLNQRGVPVLSVIPTSNGVIALDLWHEFPTYEINGVLLIRVPMLAHGCRLYNMDRMIWVDNNRPDPHDRTNFPIYLQSMSRGNMPWGQPAKWDYTDDEIISPAQP